MAHQLGAQRIAAIAVGHHLERVGEECVASVNRGRDAELGVRRRHAVSQVVLVHHVIVDQRKVVDRFQRGGIRHCPCRVAADQLARQQCHHRPQPLAACERDVRHRTVKIFGWPYPQVFAQRRLDRRREGGERHLQLHATSPMS